MKTRTKDLLSDKRFLEERVAKYQRELDAINALINARRAREQGEPTTNPIASFAGAVAGQLALNTAKQQVALSRSVKIIADEFNDQWFSTRDVCELLFEKGIRSREDLHKVRPVVSGYLRASFERLYLERRNIGEGGHTEFQYRKRKPVLSKVNP